MDNFSSLRFTVRRLSAYRGPFFAFFIVVVITVASIFVMQRASDHSGARTIRSSVELVSADAHLELATRAASGDSEQASLVERALAPLEAIGAVNIEHSTRSAGSDSDFLVWDVTLDRTRLSPAELSQVMSLLPGVVHDMKATEISPRGLAVEGDLNHIISLVDSRVQHLAGASTAAVLVVLAIALLAVIWFAQAIRRATAREQGLLVARGLSVRFAGIEGAVHGMTTGALGAVVGVAVGALFLFAFGIPSLSDSRGWAVAGALVLVATILAATILCVLQTAAARALMTVPNDDSTARGSRGLLGTICASLVVVFALWRLAVASSPPDVLSVLSPALLVSALTALVLRMLPFLFRRMGASAERKGYVEFLGSTRIARQFDSFALPAALTVLAAALVLSNSAYVGQTASQNLAIIKESSGADLRLTVNGEGPLVGGDSFTARDVMDLSSRTGFENASAVFVTQVPVQIGALDSRLISTRGQGSHTLYTDANAVASGLKLTQGQERAQDKASAEGKDEIQRRNDVVVGAADKVATFTLTLESDATVSGLEPELIVMDSQGALVSVVRWSTKTIDDTQVEFSGSVPAGVGEWTVIGVRVGIPKANGLAQSQDDGTEAQEYTDALPRLVGGSLAVSTGDSVSDLGDYFVGSPGGVAQPHPLRDTADLAVLAPGNTIALVPIDVTSPLDAVVTQAVVDVLGETAKQDGEQFDLRVGGSTVAVRISGVIDQLPGPSNPQVAVESARLAQYQFARGVMPSRASQLWVRADSSKSVSARTLSATHERAENLLTHIQTAGLKSASNAPLGDNAYVIAATLPPSADLIFKIATISVIALSALGMTAALRALARERHAEVRALRALGVKDAQLRLRRAEMTVVFGAALGGGVLVGILVLVAQSKFFGATTLGLVPLDPALLVGGFLLLLGAIAGSFVLYQRATRRMLVDYDSKGAD